MEKKKSLGIRYPATTQKSVVEAIVSGELLLEEAMNKYRILSRRTIVRWLKRYQFEEAKKEKSGS